VQVLHLDEGCLLLRERLALLQLLLQFRRHHTARWKEVLQLLLRLLQHLGVLRDVVCAQSVQVVPRDFLALELRTVDEVALVLFVAVGSLAVEHFAGQGAVVSIFRQ
jgi:hypothetical protein